MKVKLRASKYPVTFRISVSMLNSWLACRERAHLNYQEKLEKIDSNPLARNVGSMFHDGSEKYYNTMRDEGRRLSPQEVDQFYGDRYKELESEYLGNISGDYTLSAFRSAIELAAPLLKGYIRRWSGIDRTRTWLINEGEFRVPAPGIWGERGVVIQGFWDGVFENRRRELWIFESKTKSSLSKDLADRLSLDLQLQVYRHATKHFLGREATGALYNVVIRPGLRKRKGRGKNPIPETAKEFANRCAADIDSRPHHYFHRIESTVSQSRLEEGDRNLVAIIGDFMEWQRGKAPTYKNSQSCENPFRCDFLELCTGGEHAHNLYRKKGTK